MAELRVLATGLEFPEGPVAMPDGSVVLVEIRGRRLTRVYPDGRKEVVAQIPGGPNGAALGPDGILINMSRGSVVDEPALIEALQQKKILSAGLDVFAREPEVPAELMAMDHVVLFPHLGSASVATRDKMDQLVVDNLLAWAAGKPPLTPVSETPWPPKTKRS